jgi:hypothetical protein
MDKIPSPMRHVFTIIFTTVVYAAIAYFVLRPMEWRSQLLHLFVRSFNAFTAMQSSNGPGWIISVVGSSLFTIIFTLVVVGAVRGGSAMRKHWLETGAIALLALIGQIVLLYGPIYLRTLTRVVYSDHQDLVARANAPQPSCPSCPTCSTCPAPKVITHTAEEPHKCWMTNHSEFPGPRKEKVLTATTVIIHCNYRIEAPFVVQLAFAEDNFIGADTAFLPDERTVMGGGGFKQGKMSVAMVQSPSLPAHELVTILALGTTDQPPLAVDFKIGSK